MAAVAETGADKRQRPVGICPRCHLIVRTFDRIGQKCAKPLPFATKCPGVIRSALAAEEWMECSDCGATGRLGDHSCARCDGEGWLYDKRRLRV